MRYVPYLFTFTLLAQQAQPPASVLGFPVNVDLGPVFQQVERLAPKAPPGVETWAPLPNLGTGAALFRYNMYRDPLSLRFKRNRLMVRTMVHYWLEVGLKAGSLIKGVASCGLGKESYRRVFLGAYADMAVTPQWDIALKVQPMPPEALDPCEITMFQVDITPQVLGGMTDQILKAVGELERQVSQAPVLRQAAEGLWREVQKPQEVAPGIWLAMNPEGIRLGTWTGEGRTLTIPLEVQARPALTLGAPPVVPPAPLPSLGLGGMPHQDGFRVHLEADLPFEHATAQLQRQLRGKRFDTEKGSFEIRDIVVGAKDGKPLLELSLGGKIEGKLGLTGHAVFDEATATLRLKDLDFTLESQSWIQRFGVWLLHASLKKTLEQQGNLIMDKSFKDLQDLVQKGLNRTLAPGLDLKGTLERLRMESPQVLTDRFRVQAYAEGKAQIAISRGLA